MRILASVMITLALTASSHAACFGTGNFKTCYDNNGNTYNVQKLGNQTITNGSNSATGSTWSQTDTTFGNTTITNGQAANGNSWNMTQQNFGNGLKTYNGTDSDGNSFSGSCTSILGCN